MIELDAMGMAPGGVLALVPHPDDESLAMGAAIATAARAGRPRSGNAVSASFTLKGEASKSMTGFGAS